MSFPMENDPQPDLDEVQQRETDETPADTRMICVVDEIRDPVRVQTLPARLAVLQSVTVTSVAREVFGKDLRRARAVFWPLAQTPAVQLYVGTRRDEVQAGTAAIMTTDFGSLEMKNDQPLYARAVTTDVVVSYLLEQWAD